MNDANLTVGVLAVQIPVDLLGAIVNNEQGMGGKPPRSIWRVQDMLARTNFPV